MILPTIRNIKNISFKINIMKIDVEKKYDSRISLRNAIKKFKAIKEGTEKFVNIYVKEKEELKLITKLEDMAAKNSLRQEINLIYNEKKSKDQEMQIEIEIKLVGDYVNITKYLYDLRRIDYYINLDSITINVVAKKDNLTDVGDIQTNLSGNFYILSE
ncbi:MAG: type 4a pilus biogenesis protein PilO [bacterium]